jgi:hypothetical protein
MCGGSDIVMQWIDTVMYINHSITVPLCHCVTHSLTCSLVEVRVEALTHLVE